MIYSRVVRLIKSFYKFFAILIVLIISIVISLLLLEIVLHLTSFKKIPLLVDTNVNYEKRYFLEDSLLIYKNNYQENNYLSPQSIDNQATIQLRPDYRQNWESSKSTFNILMLGDSFTYGHKVQNLETYPSKTEEILIEKEFDVNVFNAGTSGYGVDQSYLLALDFIVKHELNLLILNLNQNDILDSNDNCLFKLSKNSEYRLVSGKYSNIFLQSLATKHFPKWFYQSHVGNLLLSAFSHNNERRNYACSITNIQGSDLEQKMLNKITHLLRDLKRKLSKKNIDLILTMMPTQAYFDLEISDVYGTLKSRELLLDSLKKNGFQVLDFNKELDFLFESNLIKNRDINLQKDLFLSDDVDSEAGPGGNHLSSFGSYLSAKIMADNILYTEKLICKEY